MKLVQKKKLSNLVSRPVKWDCALGDYTSFAIGGPTEALVKVDAWDELQPLLVFLARQKILWRIIGRGTNLLVRDKGFAGVILILGSEFKAVNEESTKNLNSAIVRVGGGCSLGKLLSFCIRRGFAGLSFVCGIPGTVAGAVIMNAGAWEEDMSSVVHSVTLVNARGKEKLYRNDLSFSYRSWQGFTDYTPRAVVAEVELELERGVSSAIRNDCQMLLARKKATQPGQFASGGSFFKNPDKHSAGKLIEASGLKGVSLGGAMVSRQHGNFLINKNNATADDVLGLMRIIQAKVKEDSGIDLEPEIHFI